MKCKHENSRCVFEREMIIKYQCDKHYNELCFQNSIQRGSTAGAILADQSRFTEEQDTV